MKLGKTLPLLVSIESHTMDVWHAEKAESKKPAKIATTQPHKMDVRNKGHPKKWAKPNGEQEQRDNNKKKYTELHMGILYLHHMNVAAFDTLIAPTWYSSITSIRGKRCTSFPET